MDFGKKTLSFFYAWYRSPFGPHAETLQPNWGGLLGYDTRWAERGRRDTTVPHAPLDGYYHSLSDSTMRRQFQEHQRAGLDGLIVSWWGFGPQADQETATDKNYSHHATTKLLSLCPEDLKVTLYLETSQYRYDARKPIEVVVDDLVRICEEYGSHAAWLRINERPVVFIYARVLGEFRQEYADDMQAWREMRAAVQQAGHDPFVIGDSLNPDYYSYSAHLNIDLDYRRFVKCFNSPSKV